MSDRATHETELREMVQNVALALAVETVEKAEEAALQRADMVTTQDVAGVQWAIRAIFMRDPMAVRITGAAEFRAPEEGIQGIEIGGGVLITPQQLAKLFGTNDGTAASFDFLLPVAWVKAASAL